MAPPSSDPAGAPIVAAEPGSGGDAAATGRKRARRGGRLRRMLPAPVWSIGKLLLIALIVEYLVLPQIAGTRKAIHVLTQVNPLYLLVGVVLECMAIVAYAQLARAVLPPESDPGLVTVLRIQLTTLSVSHCVPGGTAAGSSLGYRLMSSAGIAKADVGFALATQGLGSAVMLNVILWLALVVSIPLWGFSPLYLTAALVGAVLIGAFTLLVLLFTRGEERAKVIIGQVATKLPFVDEIALQNLFHQLAARLQELAGERRVLVRAAAWASANWLLDAGSLWVFVGAFGHWVNPDGLLVSYGLANVLAAIPLTPGGLGVVEATLTSTLVGFHTSRAIAILGVLGYRLVNFWLPIPIGGLTYVSLQVNPGTADAEARLHRQSRGSRYRAWLQLVYDRSFGPHSEWRRLIRRHTHDS